MVESKVSLRVLLITSDTIPVTTLRGIITSTYVDDVPPGRAGPLTLGILFTNVSFPIVGIAALCACYRERHTPMKRRWVYWHGILIAIALTATAIYYTYWGLIGQRRWTV